MKMLLFFCHVITGRIGTALSLRQTAVNCAADQTGPAWGALYQISFWVEALHSFLTFTVGSVHALPLSEASWLSLCTEAPPGLPGKTPCIWLALPGSTCVFRLACCVAGEGGVGPITSRRSETSMMSSSPLSAITDCRWEGWVCNVPGWSRRVKESKWDWISRNVYFFLCAKFALVTVD